MCSITSWLWWNYGRSNSLPIFLLPYLVVNISRSQLLYNSLVNVDIQKDQFISQAVQERLLLAPVTSNKEGDSPSHLIFLTPHLMREQPFPSEEETANSKLCPLPHSSHSAFDLYRRQMCHKSLSWLFCWAVTISGILMKTIRLSMCGYFHV